MATQFLPRLPLPQFLLPSLPRTFTRSKTKVARHPRGVIVRLRRDLESFGPKGAIVRVNPGRMRNDWQPRAFASYVADTELRELGIEKRSVQRDFEFIVRSSKPQTTRRSRVKADEDEEAARQRVKAPSLDPHIARNLIRDGVPETLRFQRQTVGRLASLGNAGSGEKVEEGHSEREPQVLYGSVSKLDVVNAVKEALVAKKGDQGALVVLEAEDVELLNAEQEGEGEAERVTYDRIKTRGKFIAEIRVRGVEGSIRKTVIVEAEE